MSSAVRPSKIAWVKKGGMNKDSIRKRAVKNSRTPVEIDSEIFLVAWSTLHSRTLHLDMLKVTPPYTPLMKWKGIPLHLIEVLKKSQFLAKLPGRGLSSPRGSDRPTSKVTAFKERTGPSTFLPARWNRRNNCFNGSRNVGGGNAKRSNERTRYSFLINGLIRSPYDHFHRDCH